MYVDPDGLDGLLQPGALSRGLPMLAPETSVASVSRSAPVLPEPEPVVVPKPEAPPLLKEKSPGSRTLMGAILFAGGAVVMAWMVAMGLKLLHPPTETPRNIDATSTSSPSPAKPQPPPTVAPTETPRNIDATSTSSPSPAKPQPPPAVAPTETLRNIGATSRIPDPWVIHFDLSTSVPLEKGAAPSEILACASIRIDGYTCNLGDGASNLALSRKRAEFVRDHLVQEGFPADQITVQAHGDDQPVQSNQTASGRAANRRVTVTCVPRSSDGSHEG